MKQRDKRAFWLILAGVGMAAAAVFMFLAAERLKKSGTDKKQTAEQTLSPSPAPVEVKPIVQPLPPVSKKTPPPAVTRAEEPVEAPSMKPSPRYVYVEDPIEKAARDYDASGQVGDPPAGWKEDYSHWDSENWGIPVEKLGTPYPDGEMNYDYRPVKLTREGQHRLDEIVEETRRTRGEAAAKALFSKEQKRGDVLMLGGDFIEAHYSRAQLENRRRICRREYIRFHGTVYGNRARQFSSPNNFSIAYYRRSSDGALTDLSVLRSQGFCCGAAPRHVGIHRRSD